MTRNLDQIAAEFAGHPQIESYLNWRNDNKEIYRLFTKLSVELMLKQRRFSIRFVAHKIRWDIYVAYGTQFKVSNNITSLLSRDLIMRYPDMAKYISLRPIGSKGRVPVENGGI